MATVQVLTPTPAPFAISGAMVDRIVEPSKADVAKGDPKATAGRFILNGDAFVKLQLYLKAASMFPESNARFEIEFPRDLFEKWFKKDTQGTNLLDKTRETFVDIYSHCFSFETRTVNKMMLFADTLLTFGETQDERVRKIMDHKSTIANDALELSDPKVKAAISAVWSACTGLIADASAAQETAAELARDLAEFQTLTKQDQKAIQSVQQRTKAVLPSIEELGTQQGEEYSKIRAEMKKQYDDQVEIHHRYGNPNSGALLYINSLGVTMYCTDQNMYSQYERMDKRLKQLWDGAEDTHRRSLQMRAKTESMKEMVDGVVNTISNAIDALDKIKGNFVDFQGGLKYIQDKIKSMHGALNVDWSFLRVGAYDELEAARIRWAEVRLAAQFYKTHGVLLKRTDKELLDKISMPPPKATEAVELSGATFGSINVTKVAAALYSRGVRIEVPGLVRDFSDPAVNVEKAFTMLYKVDGQYRGFCAKEYAMPASFTYTFRKEFANCSLGNPGAAVHFVAEPKPAPKDCPIEIIAIFWGAEKRDSSKFVDYVYSCVDKAPGIEWTNARFEDGWERNFKTGVVYYRKKGSDRVQLIIGREGQVTQFNS